MTHDFTNIHGYCVVGTGVNLLNSGIVQENDVLLFPQRYRITFKNQPMTELVMLLREIQSFTCCKDFRTP